MIERMRGFISLRSAGEGSTGSLQKTLGAIGESDHPFPREPGHRYHPGMIRSDPAIHVDPPSLPLDEETTQRLRSALAACPDVAFAYLVDVRVEGVQDHPSFSLFVWLMPEAVGSLRHSLNLVAETVASVIPKERFIDVLILNSAPELLEDVERADCLLVERDAGERARAREAAKRAAEQ